MKVLIAAQRKTAHRKGDFNHCVPGELVRFPGLVCDCPDCGCERAMAGLASSKATTVFQVEDNPVMTVGQYRSTFLAALEREGWLASASADDRREYISWADEHLSAAARFEPGHLLELVDSKIRKRRVEPHS